MLPATSLTWVGFSLRTMWPILVFAPIYRTSVVAVGRAMLGNSAVAVVPAPGSVIVVGCTAAGPAGRADGGGGLLAVFPFDFSQLADLLPRSVQLAFFWVNNDAGALVLVIIGVASLASMVYNSVMFLVVSHAESTGHDGRGPTPSGWQV